MKSKVFLIFSIILLIVSIGFFGFRYITYSNVVNYWGNDIIGKGLWLHSDNTNTRSLTLDHEYGGDLFLLSNKDGVLTFLIQSAQVNLLSSETVSVDIKSDMFDPHISKLYLFNTINSSPTIIDNYDDFVEKLTDLYNVQTQQNKKLNVGMFIIEDPFSGKQTIGNISVFKQ